MNVTLCDYCERPIPATTQRFGLTIGDSDCDRRELDFCATRCMHAWTDENIDIKRPDFDKARAMLAAAAK